MPVLTFLHMVSSQKPLAVFTSSSYDFNRLSLAFLNRVSSISFVMSLKMVFIIANTESHISGFISHSAVNPI